VGEHLVRVGHPLDQVAHLALHLGHRGHEPRRVAGLREPDVEAHVRAPVDLEGRGRRGAHVLGERVEQVEVLVARPLAGQHGGAGLHHHPVVEHRARLFPERQCRALLTKRRLLDHEGPARAPALRHEVPALHERGERLPECRARDAQHVGQLALGGQAGAWRKQAQPDRRSEPLHRLLERRG
jgi:hypothetical protein